MTPQQQAEADAARAKAIIDRNDAVIIAEYHANGLVPIITELGRPLSLYLARMMGLPLESNEDMRDVG